MLAIIWDEFLKIVQQEKGTQVVETWLKAVALRRWDSQLKVLYARVPNQFVQDWVQSNYLDLFHTHLARLLSVDTVRIIFFTDQEEPATTADGFKDSARFGVISAHSPSPQASGIIASQDLGSTTTALESMASTKQRNRLRGNINKAYLFSTFVVGSQNQLAFAAAHSITQKLGKLYNPLFIYGSSGLGKTHLLHAIGNEVAAQHKKATVLYQTADRFVNEFINAIRFDKIYNFQAKYKDVDVLLIDDLQFISNKEQTQEAFFHIFNALYESHKQIVFSSDTYPSAIDGLAERLRSRLEGGLIADIQAPCLETKIAILKRKGDLNGLDISDEVAYYIASVVNSNVRELEGALIRVIAFASLTKQEVTIELAKRVLQREKNPRDVVLDFDRIASFVCNYFSCSLTDLKSSSRSKDVCQARHVSMYLMKALTGKSLRDIGTYLHRKDHSTVLHGIGKIQASVETDPAFDHKMRLITQELRRQVR